MNFLRRLIADALDRDFIRPRCTPKNVRNRSLVLSFCMRGAGDVVDDVPAVSGPQPYRKA